MEIKLIATGFKLAESPYWDSSTNRIYWVDILDKKIFYYDFKEIKSFNMDEYASYIGKTDKENLVVALESKIKIFSKNIEELSTVANFEDDGFRCNDGEIDQAGRLLIGRMNNKYNDGSAPFTFDGNLRQISKEKSDILMENISIPNGIEFAENNSKMYYIDSLKQELVSYEYDLEKGEIKNIRSELKITHGFMDGMCSDIYENLYIAIYGEYKIIKYNTISKKIVDIIRIPDKNITCCSFGGTDNNELYITTAQDGLKKGSIYKIKLNTKGKKKNCFVE